MGTVSKRQKNTIAKPDMNAVCLLQMKDDLEKEACTLSSRYMTPLLLSAALDLYRKVCTNEDIYSEHALTNEKFIARMKERIS